MLAAPYARMPRNASRDPRRIPRRLEERPAASTTAAGQPSIVRSVSVAPADIWRTYALAALTRAGHRSGGARNAVVELLGEQDCCLSAQEIFDALRERERTVGIASVYRVLELLSNLDLVQRIDVGEGPARYEPRDPSGHHHHHLLCDRCGCVIAFEDSDLETAIDELSERLGCDVVHHDVLLHGMCAACTTGPAAGGLEASPGPRATA